MLDLTKLPPELVNVLNLELDAEPDLVKRDPANLAPFDAFTLYLRHIGCPAPARDVVVVLFALDKAIIPAHVDLLPKQPSKLILVP